MRKFLFTLCFILCFLLGGAIGLGAFADNEERVDGIESSVSTELEVSSSDGVSVSDLSVGLLGDGNVDTSEALDRVTLTGVRLMSVAPVEPADDGSLKSVFLSLIGSYDPVVLEFEYTSNNGYVSYLREVQLDYPWLAAAVLFIVVLWCVMKVGGRILWNK